MMTMMTVEMMVITKMMVMMMMMVILRELPICYAVQGNSNFN